MTAQLTNSLEGEIERLRRLGIDHLRMQWRARFGAPPPDAFTKDLLLRSIVERLQEEDLGGLDRATAKLLTGLTRGKIEGQRHLKTGTVLVREYQGERHTVTVVPGGFSWKETVYPSLTTIARAITGTAWNGPRFFGLRLPANGEARP